MRISLNQFLSLTPWSLAGMYVVNVQLMEFWSGTPGQAEGGHVPGSTLLHSGWASGPPFPPTLTWPLASTWYYIYHRELSFLTSPCLLGSKPSYLLAFRKLSQRVCVCTCVGGRRALLRGIMFTTFPFGAWKHSLRSSAGLKFSAILWFNFCSR